MFLITKYWNSNTKPVWKAKQYANFFRLKIASHNAHIWKYITDSSLKMLCVGFFVFFLSRTLYSLCIEAKRKFVNQNKGVITLIIVPLGRVSLAMSWCSGSFHLKRWPAKKVKIIESRNQSHLWWLTRYHEKFLCRRQNVRGELIPPTSWKVGVMILGIIFLYKTKQATHFAWRNDFYALFATNKTKHILNRHFSCSCSDTIYNKSIKNNRNKSHFLKFAIPLLVNIFRMWRCKSCKQWSKCFA